MHGAAKLDRVINVLSSKAKVQDISVTFVVVRLNPKKCEEVSSHGCNSQGGHGQTKRYGEKTG